MIYLDYESVFRMRRNNGSIVDQLCESAANEEDVAPRFLAYYSCGRFKRRNEEVTRSDGDHDDGALAPSEKRNELGNLLGNRSYRFRFAA